MSELIPQKACRIAGLRLQTAPTRRPKLVLTASGSCPTEVRRATGRVREYFGGCAVIPVGRSNQMKKIISWLMNPPTNGPKSILLLRLMAGGVFFWEGLLKFVYSNQGVGRFTKLGIPAPHFTATFIGGLEIVGGLLLLTGLTTRLI